MNANMNAQPEADDPMQKMAAAMEAMKQACTMMDEAMKGMGAQSPDDQVRAGYAKGRGPQMGM